MEVAVINEGAFVRVTWQYDNVQLFKEAVCKITTDIEDMAKDAFEFLFGNVLKEYIRLGLVGTVPPQNEVTLDNINLIINPTFCSITMPQPLRLMGLFVFMGKTDVQFLCQNA